MHCGHSSVSRPPMKGNIPAFARELTAKPSGFMVGIRNCRQHKDMHSRQPHLSWIRVACSLPMVLLHQMQNMEGRICGCLAGPTGCRDCMQITW